MKTTDESDLIEKLRKIEALFARSGTDGEKMAAAQARARITQRLKDLERVERPVEYRFSMNDDWSRLLFFALLRRYGLKPFRYSGQRRTTVMVRVTRSFVDETLWPEFQRLSETLRTYLHEVTMRVISEAIHGDMGDAEERPSAAAID